ncbi:lipoate--protein ligase family protein [Candidatus Micrarchaeota archaeon]|nr:lipoate--protein ligase family protein [Candidatus Micrarchaeota archaeon]MBU1930183.1 lipoate--protein ligase family protein [Candidatus Micrarchaeota archaeon]
MVTEWRLLELESNNAFQNMALDESICEHVSQGKSPPTIRFFKWNPSAVSIGYFQSLEQEVNQAKCKELGIDIVRRRTGGGAVYHDRDGEITYSMIAPESFFPKGITESYWNICGHIITGLAHLGIQSDFKPINDIIVCGKKISGNAQTRRNGVLLQHGTILYDLDVEKMFSLLKVSKEKISDKLIASVKERVTCIKDHASVSRQELYEALQKGFCENKTIITEKISDSELERAQQLAQEKYASKEWLDWR